MYRYSPRPLFRPRDDLHRGCEGLDADHFRVSPKVIPEKGKGGGGVKEGGYACLHRGIV